MTIAQDGFTFINADTHGDILPREAFELPVNREHFWGVKGESHVIDSPKGRILDCRGLLYGFATVADLETAIANIEAQAGKLTGDVTISGSMSRTEPDCTFVGVQKLEPGVRFDAAGLVYLSDILLMWIQRNGG